MQLITIAAILATAVSVGATPIEARHGTPRVRATFFNNGPTCGPPGGWREDFVFTETVPIGACQNIPIPQTFQATYFNESSIDRTFRFYDVPCGNEENTGHHFDITPSEGSTPGCLQQGIRSYKIL